MTDTPKKQLSIRKVTPEDIPDLTRICLLTANAGQSAESLHQHSELLGGLYIEPYLKLSPTFGFVLVDTSDEGEEIRDPSDATERDRGVINRIHKPLVPPQGLVDISPAHIRISLLPQAQRQGWGVKLIEEAVRTLKVLGQCALFVGIDSRNDNARAFYLKIGFKPFPFPDKEHLVLHFDDWKGPKS
ncbi:putative GCN5-related N-acetyltransferase [Rhizoctonia solani 123E]|uniref:Putative GCN5-related N-acetyltransferase n=1 Tax=Rhizoctonia solani 123E TaxID=1423351 RepID=A0A074SR81_9AGAM|nr:putative GCN5-related N-acetyltransferase [Rhizoctonia solani 123E]